MSARRVVVTGVGAVTPLGVGARTAYGRWVAGECGIEDGESRCRDFDPTSVLSRKEARRTDRFSQLMVASCEEALEQAGWDGALPYPGERVGCVIGTGVGGIETVETQYEVLLEKGAKGVSPLGVPMLMGNAAAAIVALRHGLRGPSYGTMSACAAGAHAVGAAFRMVQAGEADAVITGGTESAMSKVSIACFGAMGATSPTGVSRPFDRRRDGFVLGEGAGALVLEDAEKAAARGAEVLGEILGYGATTDAYHLTAPEPGGAGAARAIDLALADAGITPDEVDYVNAHGTSTPLNDRVETEALKSVLGERALEVPVSSFKSAVGHLLGAGGAVEAVTMICSLRDRMAPPTLGYEEPDEGLDLDYVPTAAKSLTLKDPARAVGLSNSFGFGGHNVVLCMAA